MFISKVLPFGLTAAVTAYNRVSQCLVFIMNEFFRTPMLSYFDDFAGMECEATATSSFEAFGLLNELIGLVLKVEKDVPPTNQTDLLGFEVLVHSMSVTIRISDKRRAKLLGILEVLRAAGLEDKELERLVGDLNFSLGGFFELSGRSFLAPLYMRLNPYEKRFCSAALMRWAVDGLENTLKTAPEKLLKNMLVQEAALIYTDASSLGLGFVAFGVAEIGPLFGSLKFSERVLKLFKKFVTRKGLSVANRINWQELAAVGVALISLRQFLAHRNCIIFIDNVAVEKLLIKNYSRNVSMSVGAGIIHRLLVQWDIHVTFCRVSSKLNISDEPSRVFEDFPTMRAIGATRLPVKANFIHSWVTASGAIGAAR